MMMVTVRRVEVGLMAVLALMFVQMAFRPFTLKAFAFPLKLVTVSFAPTPTSSPAYSANLVFTSVTSFEMVPADSSAEPAEGVKSVGTGAYTVADDVAHLSLRLTGLKPDATYAIHCAGVPCSLKKPTVTADWKGRAFWSMDRTPFAEADSAVEYLVAVSYVDKEGVVGNSELSYAVISAGQ